MPTPLEDVDLLSAWRARRDEAAFREICARHTGLVAAACRRLGAPDVEEATQAVFMALAQRAGAEDIRLLANWLTGTARRVVANQRQAVRNRRRHEQEAAVEQSRQRTAAPAEPAWDEARSHLDAALASLSEGRREAVVRFYLEGRPQAEIAAELGCSADAVRVRVHEGLERLRAFFSRRGVVLGAAALASGLASEATAAEPALVASCAQAAIAPATAPGAAALATGVTGGGIGMATVWAGLAALLTVAGGFATWHALASPAAPAAPRPPVATAHASAPAGSVLLAEDFENDDFRTRGWYDNPGLVISSAEHAPGSAHAAEFRFQRGAMLPLSGEASRRLFPPADAIRIAYWITYDRNWVFSDASCRLKHLVLLTTADDAWTGPSYVRLACTIGVERQTPFISLQDARNIDVDRINQDLTAITEARAIAGGNGDSDGYGPGECFPGEAGRFWNEKLHPVPAAALTDQPGPFYAGQWHRIEVRLHLNRIVAGKAVPDGRLSYAVDGRTLLDRTHVMFRTARNADMRFNQLILCPWSGSGSPSDATLWIDDLTVSTDPDPPTPPDRP